MSSLEDGKPRFRHMLWKQAFAEQKDTTPVQIHKNTITQSSPKFSLPLREEQLKYVVWLTEEALWNRMTTLSNIANLQGEKREEVKRAVFDALKGDDVERNENGELAVHGTTYFAWISRI